MEALAPELVVHIFSFLPGHEVPRLKVLSSSIRKIINRNRIYLKYPITLSIHLQKRKVLSFKCVFNDQLGTICNIRYNNTEAVQITNGGIDITNQKLTDEFIAHIKRDREAILERSLFQPLTTETRSLQNAFDFIFQKANINKLDLRKIKGEALNILTDAINRNRCHVAHIVTNIRDNCFRKQYEFLCAIGRRQYKCPSSIESCANYVDNQWENLHDYWEKILKFNQIAHMFKEPVLYVDGAKVDELVSLISDEWNNNHVRFFFRLRVPYFAYFGKYEGRDEISFSMNEDGRTVRVQHWRNVHVENGVFRLEEVMDD